MKTQKFKRRLVQVLPVFGLTIFSKEKNHEGFCADLSKSESDFMFASQSAFYAKGFGTPITKAAWINKSTYGLVAAEGKSIAPEMQRTMYKLSNTLFDFATNELSNQI